MDISLSSFFELPDHILKIARSSENTVKLNKETISKYDLSEIEEKLDKYFQRYVEALYCTKFVLPINNDFKANEGDVTIRSNTISDLTYLYANINDESVRFLLKAYQSFMNLALKFTEKEAVYFVNRFFRDKSDTTIADILLVSRSTIISIRESCFVKVDGELQLTYRQDKNT